MMWLVLMGIKYQCTILKSEEEEMERELAVYFQEIGKVIILNASGRMIWRLLKECEAGEGSITDEEIVEHVMKNYRLPSEMRAKVEGDVAVLLNRLKEEAIIVLTPEKELRTSATTT